MATDPRTDRNQQENRRERGLADLVANPEALSSLPTSANVPFEPPAKQQLSEPEEQVRLEGTIKEQPAQGGILSRIGSGLKRLTGQGASTKTLTGIEAEQKDLMETAMKAAAGAAAIDQLGQIAQETGQEIKAEAEQESLQDVVRAQSQAQILQTAGQQIQQAQVQQQQQLQVQQLQQQAVLQEQRRREERQKRMQKRRATLVAAAQDSLVANAAKEAAVSPLDTLYSVPGVNVIWGMRNIKKWLGKIIP